MPLTFRPTLCDPVALERLVEDVPPHWKGAPLCAPMTVREFAASGVDALGGALPFPLLLIRKTALAHNVSRMADFVADTDVLLAPHAKTTMSPELIARQIRAGCWAVTVATPSQVHALRRLGVQRILIANELTERSVIRWLVDEMARDPGFEPICLVDSVAGVVFLDRELSAAGLRRRVDVLLEVGVPNGRAGVRDLAGARATAAAVNAARALELAGVECFEGLSMNPSRLRETLAAVDEHLATVLAFAQQLRADGLLREPLVSAGGSAFFDRVLARFPRPDWRVVLRSGCYITQDGGFYDENSPLGRRGHDASPLRDALELWGAVLSRPEADAVVAGVGRRDAPFDLQPPQPVAWRSFDGSRTGHIVGATDIRLNDQHLTFTDRDGALPQIGDLVRFTVSHPCGAFDRWRVIPVVDDDRLVVGAVHTVF